jgi:CheY-like chemotaxis protein
MFPEDHAAKTILVVEDDALTRAAMKSVLEREGYRVACAANGREALATLREGGRPALILLDVNMPVLDGRMFRQEQLLDPDLADIPVVVVSGASGPPPETAGYVRKPFEPRELLQTVWCFG